jgi:hypothetical protein
VSATKNWPVVRPSRPTRTALVFRKQFTYTAVSVTLKPMLILQFEAYATPPPFRSVPRFIGDTQALVVQTGGVTSAVGTSFRQANISVEIEGGDSSWTAVGQGALLVGDHRIGVEYAPLMALFGDNGREDVHFVAKPMSMQARVMAHLALGEQDLTLPVIPGTLALDRDNKLNRDLYWRMKQGDNLPTKQELRILNATTIQNCAGLSAAGYAVTLYPASGAMDAVKKTWQRGLGRIISLLPEGARGTTTVVPFRFDTFSRLHLVHALHKASKGKTPKPQIITLRVGRHGTPNELLDGAIGGRHPDEITETLRQQFVMAFADQRC